MSQLQIYNHQNTNYTLVANQFIDNYLADANDVQIKLYLYLLRHMSHSCPTSLSSIVEHFNYSEKDVLLALSYWEKKKLLGLKYDEEQNLCGICFYEAAAPSRDYHGKIPAEPFSAAEHTNSNDSAVTKSVSSDLSKSASEVSSKASVKTVTYLSSNTAFVKPDYSLDQLASFQSKETTAELVFIAESYLGRTLSSNDIRSILFISEELHFSFDLMDYLLQYCVDRNKKDFRYIEKVAINWAEADVTTPHQAQQHAARYDKNIYTVMKALGKSNQPTTKEAEFIKRWYQIYGFTSEVILEACERTVLATDKHRFEYADKILSSWKAFGVHHKSDIMKADASFAGNKKKAPSAPKNKFNQFQQRDYDFDLLEQELLSN